MPDLPIRAMIVREWSVAAYWNARESLAANNQASSVHLSGQLYRRFLPRVASLCNWRESYKDTVACPPRVDPAVHADETGWREDGPYGEIGSVSTPPIIRSNESHHSRSEDTVIQVIGEDVQGVPGSNVSASSTRHAGWQQYWWTHAVCHGHDLAQAYLQDEAPLL
jgi:hypothetical protein